MKKILILGAGLVARPPVRYLLDHPGLRVTVASRTVGKAQAILAGHPHGRAVAWKTDDQAKLSELIAEHDLAISLLPAPHHPMVARLCIEHGKQMVTTSYVSPEMRGLDEPAKRSGVLLMNEIGVDPGIDHMSAMKIIHDVQRRGGTVVGFRSYCGGLPAPQSNTNPWGYKFSWSPRAVLLAGKNEARYLEDGQEIFVPAPELFSDVHMVTLGDLGAFEAYPNRNSLGYVQEYGLEGVRTMFRGTFRNHGWCATWKKIVEMGFLDDTRKTFPKGYTYRQFTESFIDGGAGSDLRKSLAEGLRLSEDSHVLDWWEWLGLFDDEPLPMGMGSSMEVLCYLLQEKCPYAPGEQDMIALHHDFRAEFPDAPPERINSTLIEFGIPGGDSAMARTVGLPAAIAASLILQGKIKGTGVKIPTTPEIYEPVLKELESLSIKCKEQVSEDLEAGRHAFHECR